MRILTALILAICIMAPLNIQADVLVPGYKNISWCFEIENLSDYSDYHFVATYHINETPALLSPGDCIGFYKLDTATIHAIPKDSMTADEVNNSTTDELVQQNVLITSLLSIQPRSTLPEDDEREGIREIYRIVSVTEDELTIEQTGEAYTDERGNEQTYPVPDPDSIENRNTNTAATPVENDTENDDRLYWYIGLPVAGLLVVGMILLARKKSPPPDPEA